MTAHIEGTTPEAATANVSVVWQHLAVMHAASECGGRKAELRRPGRTFSRSLFVLLFCIVQFMLIYMLCVN